MSLQRKLLTQNVARWKITVTKANSLATLKTAEQQSKVRPLGFSWTAARSDWQIRLSGASQSQQTPKFALLRGLANNNNISWTDPHAPLGSALCPCRRCKITQSGNFTELEGDFSQIPCRYPFVLCACKQICCCKWAVDVPLLDS